MSEKNKKIAGWAAFLFVCFHITALFITAAPPAFKIDPAKRLVSPYVVPIFEQSWSMFAPCPVVNGKIQVKIQYEDEVVDWFYPRDNDRKWHSWLRGSHHGDLVLLEANVLYYIWADAEEFKLPYDEPIPDNLIPAFRETGAYVNSKRYAYGVSRNVNDKEPLRIWVRADLENVKTGKKGTFELPPMGF